MLVTAERRNRLTAERSAAFLERINKLPIESEHIPPEAVVLDLARRYGLSVYDAAYLELAIRTASTFATLDESLRRAAESSGVAIFKED